MMRVMTQKKSKKNGYNRATLADVAREMAKPRMAASARIAAVAAPVPEDQRTSRIGIKVI
jgi:hypothetical protein